MQNNRLEVQTPFGAIVAEPADNPDYPGIYLYLAKTGGGWQPREQTYALFEAAKETPRSGETVLRLLVYANDESDDYTNSFIFKKLGQAKYDIWIEKQNDGAYAVRVWDAIGEQDMPELGTRDCTGLPGAISAMGRIARHNPDVQWRFRNFELE